MAELTDDHQSAGLDVLALVDARLDPDNLDDEAVETIMSAVGDDATHLRRMVAAATTLCVEELRNHHRLNGARRQVAMWRRGMFARPDPPTTTEEP